jgi:predicted DCC family thiol-disulfide oxidoreductase YuxK
MTNQPPILLFDGVCNLCSRTVQFVIRHDPAGRFRFAALQSPAGQRLLVEHGLPADALDTFVLIEGARCFTRSDAAIELARRLDGAWRWLRLAAVVPRPIRDWAYGVLVRNRYRWFGRRESCMVPTPELSQRFL